MEIPPGNAPFPFVKKLALTRTPDPTRPIKVKVSGLSALFAIAGSHSRHSGTDHAVLPANYTVPASTS